jgi:hypothetical protein
MSPIIGGREFPLWVKSVVLTVGRSLPVYHGQRTSSAPSDTSQSGQEVTFEIKKSQLMLAIVAVFLLWQALLRNLPAHASRRTLPLSRIGTARTSGRSLFIRSRVSGLHVSGRTSS